MEKPLLFKMFYFTKNNCFIHAPNIVVIIKRLKLYISVMLKNYTDLISFLNDVQGPGMHFTKDLTTCDQ